MRKGLMVLVFLMMVPVSSRTQTVEVLFNGGNDAYRSGKFQEAVSAFESIIQQGFVSPEVFFNLGNAYYRQGMMARAILAYERALRLAPGDPDIGHNLRLANLRIVDRIEPVPELFLVGWIRAITNLLPLSMNVRIVLLAWIVLFSSLALAYGVRRPFAARIARWCVPGSLIVVVLAGAVLGVQAVRFNDRSEAIVMSRVLTAKNSPDPQSVDAFVLHEGLKVKVSDQVAEWVMITLADGKVGWIHSGDCERI